MKRVPQPRTYTKTYFPPVLGIQAVSYNHFYNPFHYILSMIIEILSRCLCTCKLVASFCFSKDILLRFVTNIFKINNGNFSRNRTQCFFYSWKEREEFQFSENLLTLLMLLQPHHFSILRFCSSRPTSAHVIGTPYFCNPNQSFQQKERNMFS